MLTELNITEGALGYDNQVDEETQTEAAASTDTLVIRRKITGSETARDTDIYTRACAIYGRSRIRDRRRVHAASIL